MYVTLQKPKGIRRWLQLYGLYLEAFPASERKPWTMIRKMYRKGVTDIWCLEKDGAFAGLAITINSPDIVLLDYFAVEKKQRCGGIGRSALGKLMEKYCDRGFFVEIESTLEESLERPLRLRRKNFYLSCGLEEMHTTAELFGVNMELLGARCHLNYQQYQNFYREHYNPWAAEHIWPCKYEKTDS